jgi:hypothetical protein
MWRPSEEMDVVRVSNTLDEYLLDTGLLVEPEIVRSA